MRTTVDNLKNLRETSRQAIVDRDRRISDLEAVLVKYSVLYGDIDIHAQKSVKDDHDDYDGIPQALIAPNPKLCKKRYTREEIESNREVSLNPRPLTLDPKP